MKLLRYSLILGIISLSLYLLYIGKSIFVPILISIVIWYLIINLASEYRSIKIKNFQVPYWLSIFLSILSIAILIWFLTMLINNNINRVIEVAPDYERKFKALVFNLYETYNLDRVVSRDSITGYINVSTIIGALVNMISSIASNTGMIFIYVVLLLLEYHTFHRKLQAILPNKTDYRRLTGILSDINKEIKIYLRIKGIASLTTSIISYIILQTFGVDFAAFWALLIFILNFIPTIGSTIAVIFPVIVTLIQFDTVIPFFGVTILLIVTQITIGGILEPKFAGNKLNLSPIVIVFSLMLWGKIWGITGMFLCVPIMVIINIILAKIPATRSIAILLSANGHIVASKDK